MKQKIIKTDGKKEDANKKTYFCWNSKEHPRTYSEIMFDGNFRHNELVECPVCHKFHKITERL